MIILDILAVISAFYWVSVVFSLVRGINPFMVNSRKRVGYHLYQYSMKSKIDKSALIIPIITIIILIVRYIILADYK